MALSAEFFYGLLQSAIFLLLGIASVLGKHHFHSICSSITAWAANAWQRALKRHRQRLVPTWSWPWDSYFGLGVVVKRGGSKSASRPPTGHPAFVPAQEQLAAEVAHLLKRGRLLAAMELLRSVRAAKGALQPGPSCFRMVMQRLARSAARPDNLSRITQEMGQHFLPLDPLTQGCYVRCLCRGHCVDVKKAHQAYTAMLQTGTAPDLRTVECLIEACLREERHDLVKPVILALDDYNLEPSPTLFSALIISCASTGAVACGLVAFEQIRKNVDATLVEVQLAYSSTIYMCAQNQQVDRALKLLAESRQFAREMGLPPAPLESRLLPPLLAAAVQTESVELALDLAGRARNAMAATAGTAKDRELALHMDGLCKLLRKRHSSRALMVQVSDVLASAPSAASTGGSQASLPADKDSQGFLSGILFASWI